jgi:hypothetical protein
MVPKVVSQIMEELGRPSVDLFASDTWHVASRFVSPRFVPGCTAVDALNWDWRGLIPQGELAWIFPPVRAVPQAIQKMIRFRTDAILIVPESPTTNWWLELQALKTKAKMLGPIRLERSTDICTPSRRVPGTLNPALFKLRAYKVAWQP